LASICIAGFGPITLAAPLAASDPAYARAPRSGVQTPGARTSVVRQGRGRRSAGIVRPLCTGTGFESFYGGGDSNNAATILSAVLAGEANNECEPAGNTLDGENAIVGGYQNSISGGSDFIGSGDLNGISGDNAFIGSGKLNATTGDGAFVGAGGWLYDAAHSSSQFSVDNGNVASGNDSFVGAGDLNQVSGQGAFIGAGGSSYAATGASPPGNQVSGTDSFIGAGDRNGVDGAWAFVGGGEGNVVTGAGSFIGAGGYLMSSTNGPRNEVTGADAFIGDGDANLIESNGAFIGGGLSNSVSVGGIDAAIAGGDHNTASAAYGAITGGYHNSATATAATVGGGSSSSATGTYATIPGGYLNAANGIGSFAAGTQAKARHNGAFVWSDNNGTAPVQSTAPYQFMARASGGFYLFSNAAETAGVRLNAGSGAWASLSDRTMKTGVIALDDAAVLAKVAALPVNEWSYTSEHGVRHVGPMAQDFYAAFRVGEDDRHITSIDEDGVALAAIKALAEQSRSLHAENRDLRERLAQYAAHVARDEARHARDDARLLALERKVDALATR